MGDEEPKLPYDIEIEQALIGAAMIDGSAMHRVADRLAPNDFYDPFHGRLFEAMLDLSNRGRAVTPLTLANLLTDDASFREVGGRDYLASLARAAPPVPNLIDYARILRDLRLRRDMYEIAAGLQAEALKVDIETGSAQAVADRAAEALYEATHQDDPGEGPVPIYDLMQRALASSERATADPKSAMLTTGLVAVDEALSGLARGCVTVLGAATSMGKSSFAACCGLANAMNDDPTLLFSLEMTGEENAARYIAQYSGISANMIMRGKVRDIEVASLVKATETIGKIPLFVDETPNLSVAQMRARAQAVKRKRGKLALVIIDHLQFVRPIDPRAPEPDRVQQITRDIAAFAKDLDIAILLVSHLNRDHQKRASHRPINADLYGSSAIEKNAHRIWFIHREAYYLDREPPPESDLRAHSEWEAKLAREKGWADVFSTKDRRGPIGSARVRFNSTLTMFSDPPVENLVSTQDSLALVN